VLRQDLHHRPGADHGAEDHEGEQHQAPQHHRPGVVGSAHAARRATPDQAATGADDRMTGPRLEVHRGPRVRRLGNGALAHRCLSSRIGRGKPA
jgi:hypothetical protein